MQQIDNVSDSSPTKSIQKFLDHWAWELYTYTFASLFAIFALICFLIVVRQWMQPSRSRNIHGRFITVQLFMAATLKVVGLLWSPAIVLYNASRETFAGSLLIDCFSMALSLSAFSILLLILLETTKTSLATPRLQNIWVLLAITAVLTATMLTFNLLVLFADRAFWYLMSYIDLFVWGILICVGYTVAGYRMWRNLQSSRRLGNSKGERRLKTIIILVFLSPFITASTLILSLCLAASDYGIFVELEISGETMWSRYSIKFLLQSCDLAISVLIFGIVVRTKTRSCSVDDAPPFQLGTFAEDTASKYDGRPTDDTNCKA